MLKPHARIAGIGKHLPERILTNHDIEKLVETSDEYAWLWREWIEGEEASAGDG